ncbi:putative UPF0481 protein At3g02645 [Mangifera indica]|uniref:putative UPF0481 protein At3g02645 n=1 Tax=Mangifera indica TaxID=29780 RepID=UPI001CFB2EC0|nr:putative UPF0481 protein At3g02645 [Mangifera indica]
MASVQSPRKFPQHKDWVIDIIRSLEEEFESNVDETSVAVSIFNVPKTLLLSKPEAYVPHMVAIGPYHHGRLELFEMERYKLISVKRTQGKLQSACAKFHDLVNQFAEQDTIIRACFHRFLDFDRRTLSWMLAIDAAFLLEYLQPYARRKGGGPQVTRVSSLTTHLIDYTRRKSAHQAILRDIIMMENQIPLFLIKKVHVFYKHESDERDSDEEFVMMLMGFCKDLSPLKIRDNQRLRDECLSQSHLLELLYIAVTPDVVQTGAGIEEIGHQKGKGENYDDLHKQKSCLIKCFKAILAFMFFIYSSIINLLGRICKSKLFDVICAILKKLFHDKTKAIEAFMESTQDANEEAENVSSIKNETPSIEEIEIPSVTELSKIGVRFSPSEGGLDSIKFDKNNGKFYLPVVDLDDNSDVVLRNVVAYEASVAPETMIFTRYVELMNGLVDTAEDVKRLREAGIILNRLKSDEEVANLWNGMTLSVKMTKVPVIDKAIDSIKKYYSGLWKVKMIMLMKKYVFNSWPAFTFLGANLLILLSAVEAFCSVYSCSKWFNHF